MKQINHPLTAGIALTTIFLCVIDIFLRLNVSLEQQQIDSLPKVPSFETKTASVDAAPILEKFLPFDVRWQNEVKRAQEAQQNQEKVLPLFEQTITLSAIISENTTVALLKKERRSTQQVEFIKLSVGDNLSKFTVSQINDVSVILKNTNGDSHSLQLFKPTNYLTFTVNNNDQ